MPIEVVPCDPELYVFLVRYPEIVVNMWQLMGVTKVTMKRTGSYAYDAQDGAGTVSQVELVYGTREKHLFLAKVIMKARCLPGRVTGRCALLLQAAYSRSDAQVDLRVQPPGRVRSARQCRRGDRRQDTASIDGQRRRTPISGRRFGFSAKCPTWRNRMVRVCSVSSLGSTMWSRRCGPASRKSRPRSINVPLCGRWRNPNRTRRNASVTGRPRPPPSECRAEVVFLTSPVESRCVYLSATLGSGNPSGVRHPMGEATNMPGRQVVLAVIGGGFLGLFVGALLGAAIGGHFAPVESWQERGTLRVSGFRRADPQHGRGSDYRRYVGSDCGLACWVSGPVASAETIRKADRLTGGSALRSMC